MVVPNSEAGEQVATTLVSPFDKGAAPVGPPSIMLFPNVWPNSGTTVQVATSTPATGVLQLFTRADLSMVAGQGVASTAAQPFIMGCFEIQQDPEYVNYVFEFLFDYVFDVLAEGKIFLGMGGPTLIKVKGLKSSQVFVRAVTEVFDRDGNLIADDFRPLFEKLAIFTTTQVRVANNGAIFRLAARLKKNMSYYWKFTFFSIVLTSLSAVGPKKSACGVDAMPGLLGVGNHPGAAGGAFKGLTLRRVRVIPDIYPFKCP